MRSRSGAVTVEHIRYPLDQLERFADGVLPRLESVSWA